MNLVQEAKERGYRKGVAIRYVPHAIGRMGSSDEYIASVKRNAIITQRIRRLTPREFARLMDFPETMKFDVSDSQIYKQMGNSIVVACLVELLKKLNL